MTYSVNIYDFETVEGIQKGLEELCVNMSEKGLVNPRAEVEIKSDRNFVIWVKYDNLGRGYELFTGADVKFIFLEAFSYIASLPSPEEKDLTDFNTMVAKCIDFAADKGIDDEFVEPLKVAREAMTSNLLTFSKG